MPYVPRAPRPLTCAHCGVAFTAVHLRRKYCCNSCNVLAAQARQQLVTRAAAAAALLAAARAVPPASCPIPARFQPRVGAVKIRTIPRLLDPIEMPGYRVGEQDWVQGYESQEPVNWLAAARREVYRTQAFWVSAAGQVLVHGDDGPVGPLIPVTEIVPPETSEHNSIWGPFHGREYRGLEWDYSLAQHFQDAAE